MRFYDYEEDMEEALANPYTSVTYARQNEQNKQQESLSWSEAFDAAWTGAKSGVGTYAPERFYRALRTVGRIFGTEALEEWTTQGIEENVRARGEDPWYKPDESWMQKDWGKALYEGFANFTSGTVTMLPGAAAALASAPLTGGASLGALFFSGSFGSAGISGFSEYDSFIDEAYAELSAIDPTITKETIRSDKFWEAALSGIAEGGMGFAQDMLMGKFAGILGKPAAQRASSLFTQTVRNIYRNTFSELGEEAATAVVQDWAKETAGLQHEGRWEAIKNIIKPTIVAGVLGGAQNTAIAAARGTVENNTRTADEEARSVIARHTAGLQREALSAEALGLMQAMEQEGTPNAFGTALIMDRLATRWSQEHGQTTSEFFKQNINKEALNTLTQIATNPDSTFSDLVDGTRDFLWDSLPDSLKESLGSKYLGPDGVDLTALGNDLKAWMAEGESALEGRSLSDIDMHGFETMRDLLVDSVDALQGNSRITLSGDVTSVIGKHRPEVAVPVETPAFTRNDEELQTVLTKYGDVSKLTSEQRPAFVSEVARAVRFDALSGSVPQTAEQAFSQAAKALEPVISKLQDSQKRRSDANVFAKARQEMEGNPGMQKLLETFDKAYGMDQGVAVIEMIIDVADVNVSEASTRFLNEQNLENALQLEALVDQYKMMKNFSKGIGSEQGRALRMRRFNRKDPRFSDKLAASVQAMGGIEKITGLATTIQNARDATERGKLIDAASQAKVMDAFIENVTAGMLFGPSTHFVNAVSNGAQLFKSVVDRAYASYLGDNTEGGIVRGEVTAMLQGFWGGIQEIKRLWKLHRGEYQPGIGGTLQAIQNGTNLWSASDDASILMDTGGMRRSISGENFQRWTGLSSEHSIISGGLSAMVEYYGRLINLPFTALLHSDQVFKTIAFSMEQSALIHRAAKGDPAKIAQMHQRPPEDIKRGAQSFAKQMTFQDDLGKVGNYINGIRNEMPWTRLLLPFLKTPINVFKEGARMTPGMNLLLKDFRADLKSENPATRQMAEAKLMVGTMLWSSALMAASAGYLTGPGPEDPDERKKKLATGWKPNALKIGDNYYQIDRLDPLAAVFNSAAFMVEVVDNIDTDDVEQAFSMGIGQTLRLLSDRTYVQSFSDAMQLITNFEKAEPDAKRRFAGMVVPASGLWRSWNREDPYLREADDFFSALRQNVPGLSSTLPIRRDFLGQPIKNNEYAVSTWLSPFQVGRQSKDPVYTEVARLHSAGLSAAPMPNRWINRNNQRYKMTGEEYSGFLDLYGSGIKINGLTAKKALDRIVKSSGYQRLSDDQRADRIKATLIPYNKAARDRVIGESPNIRKALEIKSKGLSFFLGS